MKRNSLDSFRALARAFTRAFTRDGRPTRARSDRSARSVFDGPSRGFPESRPVGSPRSIVPTRHHRRRREEPSSSRIESRDDTYRSGSKPRTAPNCARDAFFAADARGATTTRDAATVVALVSIISSSRRGSGCAGPRARPRVRIDRSIVLPECPIGVSPTDRS